MVDMRSADIQSKLKDIDDYIRQEYPISIIRRGTGALRAIYKHDTHGNEVTGSTKQYQHCVWSPAQPPSLA